MMALMKKINDGNPENRVFENPETHKKEIWKGKIIITTNKNVATLAKNEDFKAIQSRVNLSDIQFTRNETMEILANRYMKMSLPDECNNAFKKYGYTEEDIEDFRQDVFDFMQDHLQEADPNKFTPRAFIQLCKKVAPVWKSGPQVINTGTIKAGTDLHWRKTALSILKAEENDIEKAEEENSFYSREEMIERKKNLEKTMTEAKKNGSYEKLFGTKAQDLILFGEDATKDSDEKKDESKESEEKESKKSEKKEPTEDEAKKAFDDDMTLDEAESILLS